MGQKTRSTHTGFEPTGTELKTVIILPNLLTTEVVEARLAPSLCISHSTKPDMHGILMNPFDELENLLFDEILPSAPNSGKKVIQSSCNTLDKRTKRKSNLRPVTGEYRGICYQMLK